MLPTTRAKICDLFDLKRIRAPVSRIVVMRIEVGKSRFPNRPCQWHEICEKSLDVVEEKKAHVLSNWVSGVVGGVEEQKLRWM